ncbi:MAG TPA: phenylalanine--tRNA ligase subunit beta [Mycobacteriales bacterium]|nr:phenylalanine--tRNA ligase subunit beta [Mycobacteriales bacterium]
MRVPLSWLGAHLDLGQPDPWDIAERLTNAGLKVERVDVTGADIDNVVVARVLTIEELTEFKKPIRWVSLTDGKDERHVICGAANFAVGDLVAYARPPAMLPGGFRVDRRTAYGRESDGMICSARELGIGDDHTGIVVLRAHNDTVLGDGDDPGLALGADVVSVLGLRDTVLELGINPDRGYALSIRGVAREVATSYRLDFRDPADLEVATSSAGYPVRIDDVDGCDRYVARVITGVDPTMPSPRWLQRRLTLAGMRPISLAVDVTNHVMLELGQPLHAFDRGRLTGDLVVRRAAGGETIRTLDDVVRTLDPTDLVIADDSGAVAIAGVMGGASTEIGATSTDIVLESAHFDPTSIAYTSRRHRLVSEASRRFERGVDAALAPAAAESAVRLLAAILPVEAAASTDIDKRRERASIELDPGLPSRLAGVPYTADQVRGRLVDVGCAVDGEVPLIVMPPSWRPDLRRPVDLVEEVVRLEGYDALPTTVPRAPAGRGLTLAQRQRRQVGRALAAAGWAEVLTYPFTAPTVGDALLLPPTDERRPSVRVANPVSDEEPMLRASLLPGLLGALARNVGRGFPDAALFEVGPVFRWRSDAADMPRPPVASRPDDDTLATLDRALPAQPLHVAVAVTGNWDKDGWWGPGRPAGWQDVVQAVRGLADAVGAAVEVTAADVPPWHPGRCAALIVDGAVVGHAGELHPRVIESLELPAGTCAAELALEPVLAAAPEVTLAPVVSAYPPATVDVALVVDAAVPAAAVEVALRAGAGPLLEELRLFDIYTGDPIPAGKRSLAFSLRLRAPDRTLSSEESVAIRDAAVAVAAERCGAVLRG